MAVTIFWNAGHKIVGIAVLLLGISVCCAAQPLPPPAFELEPLQGSGPAPLGRIVCMHQDRSGFIWIGTQTGLYRFDGYEYRLFQHDREDPESLSDDRIGDIMEDELGLLWISTRGGGLNCYNPYEDRFQVYRHDPTDSNSLGNDVVRKTYQDANGGIWIAHQEGLDQLWWVDETPKFTHFVHDPENPRSLVEGSITSVSEGPDGKIWAASWRKGICRLDQRGENPGAYDREARFTRFPQYDSLIGPKGWNVIFDTFQDREGRLWVAGASALGLIRAPGEEGGEVTFDFFPITLFESEPGKQVIHTVKQDPTGQIWVVSGFGVHQFHPDQGVQETYLLEASGVVSKGSNPTYELLPDREGGIWVGAQEGVYKTTGKMPAFRNIKVEKEGRPLVVTAVLRDRYGQIWMGTETEGIAIADPEGKIYTWIQENGAQGLGANFIMCFLQEMAKDRDRIWVGTYGGGLNILTVRREAETGAVRKVRVEQIFDHPQFGSLLPDHYIYSFFQEDEKTVWFGSYRGVGRLNSDLSGSRLKTLFVGNQVVKDPAGTLWIGADDGMYQWKAGTDTILPYHPQEADAPQPGQDQIIALHADPEGRLWAGTQKGLFVLAHEDQPGKLYQTRDGLSHNVIRSITEDGRGGLWMGTQRGLTYLHPKTGQIRAYTIEEGIVNEKFALRSAFRDRAGNLFLGGDNGVLAFHPDSLAPAVFDPPVYLTDLQLFNESVPLHAPREPGGFFLKGGLSSTEVLQLKYRHKVITFGFAALAYRLPQKVRYAFMLEGFDAAWSTTDADHRRVTYTNLDPGKYIFRVRAENQDGQVSPHELAVRVEIAPPWYRTWWAWTLYGVLLVAGLYLGIRLRVRAIRREMETQAKIETAKHEERERVRAESARDFHDEAGNRITRLTLYANLLKRQAEGQPEMLPMLDKMEENIQTLSSGMRDFIWVLDPQHDALMDILLRLKSFGDGLFEDTDIHFTFQQTLPEDFHISLDVKAKRHILLIFKEAMHNAIKYAACTRLEFQAQLQEGRLVISLKDNGKGFAESEVSRVNGLKNMRQRAAEIGANLEIHAEPGQGTEVVFWQDATQNTPNG